MGDKMHTPGPWSVFHRHGTIAIDIGAEATGTRPNIVDWPGFDANDLDQKTNLANARLIASAPALLEALEQARTYMFDEAERRDFDPPIPTELVADIDAAIAAAKGEAQ